MDKLKEAWRLAYFIGWLWFTLVKKRICGIHLKNAKVDTPAWGQGGHIHGVNLIPANWDMPTRGLHKAPQRCGSPGEFSERCSDIAKSIDWSSFAPHPAAASAMEELANSMRFIRRFRPQTNDWVICYKRAHVHGAMEGGHATIEAAIVDILKKNLTPQEIVHIKR